MTIYAMYMSDGYSDGANPIIDKSEFILSVFERLKDKVGVTPKEKFIIDRCVSITYRDFDNLTLIDLKDVLEKQPEDE